MWKSKTVQPYCEYTFRQAQPEDSNAKGCVDTTMGFEWDLSVLDVNNLPKLQA